MRFHTGGAVGQKPERRKSDELWIDDTVVSSMKFNLIYWSVLVSLWGSLVCWAAEPEPAALEPAALYPSANQLTISAGDTTYYVDPVRGDDDRNSGKSASRPWKSFARVNGLRLGPGDRAEAPRRYRKRMAIDPGWDSTCLRQG